MVAAQIGSIRLGALASITVTPAALPLLAITPALRGAPRLGGDRAPTLGWQSLVSIGFSLDWVSFWH